MARQRLCRICMVWHDADDWPLKCVSVTRKARSDVFPMPMLIRDFDEPVQSMADGQWYTSKKGLAASHRASGNPQGLDYVEVGNEDTTKFVRPERDRKADREAIERALNDVENGAAPPVMTELPV